MKYRFAIKKTLLGIKWLRRKFLVHDDFGKCRCNVDIENPCYINSAKSVFVDANVKLRHNLTIINAPTEKVTIKQYSVLAPYVTIITNNHRSTVGIPHSLLVDSHINDKSTDVTINEDVWIGTRAIIMPGITLGRGCIVSAGALVTHSVPPYALVVGSPAKIVKHIFSIEQIIEHESVLYPPEQRFSRSDLEMIFENYYKEVDTYGIKTCLTKEEKERIVDIKKRSHFVDWMNFSNH